MAVKNPKKKKSILASKKKPVPRVRRMRRSSKTVQLYLSLFMVIFVGLVANHFWAPTSHQVLGDSTNLSASSLLANTNFSRTENNEAPLSINADLMKAAQAKANDMVRLNFWSHNTPNGTTPWTFISNSGYLYQSAGENLAYGFITSQAVMLAWMNSPEHRVNVLNPDYRDVGFGIANSPNYQGKGPETVVVAMYGQPASPVILATTNKKQLISSTVGSNIPAKESISRIQLIFGNYNSWLELTTIAITVTLLVVLIVRHSIKWRRILINGETFIHKHPWLDVGIMTFVMMGYVFSRTTGYIG